MENSKKTVKLAVIKQSEPNECPFGLPMLDGCKSAGKLVNNMTPIIPPSGKQQKLSKDEIETIKEANNRVLMLSEDEPIQCKYANFIFEEKKMVECSYGDSAAGIGTFDMKSPSALNQYLGVGFYSVPLGFYNQDLTYADSLNSTTNVSFASENIITTKTINKDE